MFKDYLCHIANTIFGMYQLPFNEQWDRLLNRILDEGDCLSAGPFTATFWLNDSIYEVWTTNRWYAYAELYRVNETSLTRPLQARPRFRTMRRLSKHLSGYREDDL